MRGDSTETRAKGGGGRVWEERGVLEPISLYCSLPPARKAIEGRASLFLLFLLPPLIHHCLARDFERGVFSTRRFKTPEMKCQGGMGGVGGRGGGEKDRTSPFALHSPMIYSVSIMTLFWCREAASHMLAQMPGGGTDGLWCVGVCACFIVPGQRLSRVRTQDSIDDPLPKIDLSHVLCLILGATVRPNLASRFVGPEGGGRMRGNDGISPYLERTLMGEWGGEGTGLRPFPRYGCAGSGWTIFFLSSRGDFPQFQFRKV